MGRYYYFEAHSSFTSRLLRAAGKALQQDQSCTMEPQSANTNQLKDLTASPIELTIRYKLSFKKKLDKTDGLRTTNLAEKPVSASND